MTKLTPRRVAGACAIRTKSSIESSSPRAVGATPALSRTADAAAADAAEHRRQRLPQHLAPLLERGVHDARTCAAARPRSPRGSASRSNATSTLSTFGTGQNTWRDTVPASRHGPYQAALTLGRAVHLRAGRRGEPLPHLGLHHHDAALEPGERLEEVQQHRHATRCRAGSRRAPSGSPGSSVTRSASASTTVSAPSGDAVRGRGRGQALGEAVVDLDGGDGCPGLEDREGQRSETRPHLDHAVARNHLGDVHDLADRVGVDDEVLPELLGRRDVEVGGEGADLGGAEEGHGHAFTVRRAGAQTRIVRGSPTGRRCSRSRASRPLAYDHEFDRIDPRRRVLPPQPVRAPRDRPLGRRRRRRIPVRLRLVGDQRRRRLDLAGLRAERRHHRLRRRDRAARLRRRRDHRRQPVGPLGAPAGHVPRRDHVLRQLDRRGARLLGLGPGAVARDRRSRHRHRVRRRARLHRRDRAPADPRRARLAAAARDHARHLRRAALGRAAREQRRRRRRGAVVRPRGVALDVPRRRRPVRGVRHPVVHPAGVAALSHREGHGTPRRRRSSRASCRPPTSTTPSATCRPRSRPTARTPASRCGVPCWAFSGSSGSASSCRCSSSSSAST